MVCLHSSDVEPIQFEVIEGRKKYTLKRPIRMSTIYWFVQGQSLLAGPHNINEGPMLGDIAKDVWCNFEFDLIFKSLMFL